MEVDWTFLPRALTAILAALVLGTMAVVMTDGGLAAASEVLTEEFARRGEEMLAAWREFTSQPQWQELVKENASADQLALQVERQFTALPRWQCGWPRRCWRWSR